MQAVRSARRGLPVLAGLVAGLCAACTAQAGEYGEVNIDARLRLETADIDGVGEADNASIRSRLGYTTPAWKGLQAMVEGGFTAVADEDAYNAAGVHGDPDKAVIADPKNAQLDQLFASYRFEDSRAKVGRQRIVLDNARFVGDVGWRQNRQTYDAVSLKNSSLEGLDVYYAYVDNVVRIFGSEAPGSGANAEEAEASSHLVNLAYALSPAATVVAYAYLLDLDDIPATLSSDTYGFHIKGALVEEDDVNVGYRAEYAYQEDAGDNPLAYEADYYHLSVNGELSGLVADAGYEVLGSDNTGTVDEDGAPVFAGFSTPLATGHKFNGFADRFLATPPEGLQDLYLMLGYLFDLPGLGPLTAKAWYHRFESDRGGRDLGDEWDAVLVKPFELADLPGKFKALAKYAHFIAGDIGADTDRLTLELNYGVTF